MSKKRLTAVIAIAALFIVGIPLLLIWLFSFSVLPWNSLADGMLQYFGTATAALATVYLGYQANEQNKRLIRLEEDGKRAVPCLEAKGAVQIERIDDKRQRVIKKSIDYSEDEFIGFHIYMSFTDPYDTPRMESRLSLEIDNYGGSPIMGMKALVKSSILSSPIHRSLPLTVIPRKPATVILELPEGVLESDPIIEFTFTSLSGIDTRVFSQVINPPSSYDANNTDSLGKFLISYRIIDG